MGILIPDFVVVALPAFRWNECDDDGALPRVRLSRDRKLDKSEKLSAVKDGVCARVYVCIMLLECPGKEKFQPKMPIYKIPRVDRVIFQELSSRGLSVSKPSSNVFQNWCWWCLFHKESVEIVQRKVMGVDEC